MRALVVYESMFGNTRTIAEAVADGLATRLDVRAMNVTDAPTVVDDDVDLVVVGGPTHAFGMSRPSTRRSAVDQGAAATAADAGMREWIDAATLPATTVAATFDTRVKVPGLPGSAARKARRRLRRKGVTVLAPPVTFWVEGTPGPLREGERRRATRWGEELGTRLAERRGAPSAPRTAPTT